MQRAGDRLWCLGAHRTQPYCQTPPLLTHCSRDAPPVLGLCRGWALAPAVEVNATIKTIAEMQVLIIFLQIGLSLCSWRSVGDSL
jgi:hypothetical protein